VAKGKKYKKVLQQGFAHRELEVLLIEKEIDTLPWWIEELWTIKPKHTNKNELFVVFMTDRSWESGTKHVEKVLLNTSKMKNYSDTECTLLSLDMRKGNFEEKVLLFWTQFDDIIKTDR